MQWAIVQATNMSIRQMDLNPKTFQEIQIPRLSINLLSGMHPTNMHTALEFLTSPLCKPKYETTTYKNNTVIRTVYTNMRQSCITM